MVNTLSGVPVEHAVSTGDDRRSERRRRLPSPFTSLSGVITLLIAALAIYPLSRVVIRLFWHEGRFNSEAIRQTLATPDLGGLIKNTLIVVVVSSAIALAIGCGLAWLNERTDARMGVLTDVLPLIPFLLPPVAGAIGWVLLLSPRAGFVNASIRKVAELLGFSANSGPLDIYSWYGLIGVYVVYLVPFSFLLVAAGLRNMDKSLEEQSLVCGAGLRRTILRVTLPALAPSLGAATLLMVWQGIAMFSIPVIIGSPAHIDVLTVRIVHLMSFTYPPHTGVSVGLSALLMVLVAGVWYAQVRILKKNRFSTIGGKGSGGVRLSLGRFRWLARSVIIGYIVASTVLPVVALVLVSMNGYWTPNIAWGSLNFDALQRTVFGDPLSRRSLTNSMYLGVVCATVGMVVAAIVTLYLRRSRSRVTTWLDGMVKLPAVMSHIVLAIGVLLAFAGSPFYLVGTLTILGLAYIALYFPQGSIAADAAAAQVGGELPEASRMSGAGPGRTFYRIFLPLMLPGLIAGWAMLFSRVAGDLTASAVLSGTKNPVVGYRILDVYSNGSYARVAALACVLTFVTTLVVAVVMWLTARRRRWA